MTQNAVLKQRSITPRGEPIIDMAMSTVKYTIGKLSTRALGSDKHLCPYNFRHTRFTLLAERGESLQKIQHIKGSADMRSVFPYLHARPVEVIVDDMGEESHNIIVT